MKRSIIFGAAIVAASFAMPAVAADDTPQFCSDFLTRREAQIFHVLHPDARYLGAGSGGQVCGELPSYLRTDGQRASRGSIGSPRWNYEIWRSTYGYYGKTWLQSNPDSTTFTTKDFTSQSAVYAYLNNNFW